MGNPPVACLARTSRHIAYLGDFDITADLGIETLLFGWQTGSTGHSMSEIRKCEGVQCLISSRRCPATPSPPLSSVS